MNKKLKRAMISSGAYLALMSILLIGVSTAKYTQATVAYSSFGAAGFNTVLLGKDPDTGTFETTDGSVSQFGKTLLSEEYEPGMVYNSDSSLNTAKVFPFSVANGTCQEDVSEITQDYTISLRTTRNLPLDFKLTLGSTIFSTSGPKALDKDGNEITDADSAQMDENGIAWYEWTFRDIGNTEDGTVELDTAPVFSLGGGAVDSNEHAIIIEWPIETDEGGITTDNATSYMGELELLEVRVNTKQRNNTSEVQTMVISATDDRVYSKGVILLDSDTDTGDTVEYKVDYRAFKSTDDGLTYEFTVENGAGKSSDPETGEKEYKIALNVPLLWQMHSSGSGSLNYSYTLEVENPEDGSWQELVPVTGSSGLGNREFKVNEYDPDEERVDITSKKTENIEEYNSELYSCSENGSRYRIMKQLCFGVSESADESSFCLDEPAEDAESQLSADHFRIRIRNINGNIPSYVQLLGRIRIQVEVQ